ncbi:uncharacterized protein LOC142357727, partial [Convolutriloba macropyga]|uniref:uncharacterized protein LOC142357727 n=1 Tax=Convolutriloba macropyga TaxID=536237 RepID=UPI003F51F5C8
IYLIILAWASLYQNILTFRESHVTLVQQGGTTSEGESNGGVGVGGQLSSRQSTEALTTPRGGRFLSPRPPEYSRATTPSTSRSRLTGRSSTKRSSMAASFNATGTTSSPSPPPHTTHRQKQADPDHTAQMTEGQDLQPEPGRPVIPGGVEEMGGWGDVDGEGEGELIQRPDSRGMSTFRSSTTSIHGQLFPQKKAKPNSPPEMLHNDETFDPVSLLNSADLPQNKKRRGRAANRQPSSSQNNEWPAKQTKGPKNQSQPNIHARFSPTTQNVLVLNGDGGEEEQEREFQGEWSNEVGGGIEPTPIEDQVIPFHYSPPISNHQPTKPHTPYMNQDDIMMISGDIDGVEFQQNNYDNGIPERPGSPIRSVLGGGEGTTVDGYEEDEAMMTDVSLPMNVSDVDDGDHEEEEHDPPTVIHRPPTANPHQKASPQHHQNQMQAAQPIFNQPTQKITLDMGSNLLLGSQTKNSSPPAAMRPELKSTVFGMGRGDDGSGGSFGLPDQLPGDIRGIGGKGVTGDKQAVSFQQPGHPGQPRHGSLQTHTQPFPQKQSPSAQNQPQPSTRGRGGTGKAAGRGGPGSPSQLSLSPDSSLSVSANTRTAVYSGKMPHKRAALSQSPSAANRPTLQNSAGPPEMKV